MDEWRTRLVDDDEGLRRILLQAHRVAVIGIKPESRADEAAHYVPAYLHRAGYEIVPVNPTGAHVLGRPAAATLDDVEGPVDIVEVFRAGHRVGQHLDEILRKRPAVVWMQLGIRNDEVAQALAQAGITVVQDRCMMVEHRRLVAARARG